VEPDLPTCKNIGPHPPHWWSLRSSGQIACSGVSAGQQNELRIEPDDSRMQSLAQARVLIEEGLQELSKARAKLLTARNIVREMALDVQQCGICSGYGHTSDTHPQRFDPEYTPYLGGGGLTLHKHGVPRSGGWQEHDHLGGDMAHYHDDAGFQTPIAGPQPLEHPSSRSPE
jgi:hypothetical protein